MMRLSCYIVFFFIIARTIQGKSIKSIFGPKVSPVKWHPGNGQTREDWFRCHGYSCEAWERTKMKLTKLKIMTAGNKFNFTVVMNDTDDSLDGCIWLTEEQIDALVNNMEEELETARDYKNNGQGNVIGQSHSRIKRSLTDKSIFPYLMWLEKTVHWKFDGDHYTGERRIIRRAFNHWMDQTCMRFIELDIQQTFTGNHILITRQPDMGCRSFIGRTFNRPQQLNLQRECVYGFGTPLHEIGHVLGLWHEQQRSDRDQYITINWDNLQNNVGQFYKHNTHNINPEYNYNSVMHHGPRDGSSNGGNTMDTVNPLYQHNIGQRMELSYLDVKAINLAYCSDSCPSTLSGCQHGGYQDPNDCTKCRCPTGLGGRFCERVAPPTNAVCGGDYILTSNIIQYIESPGYKQRRPYDNHITCSWRFMTTIENHLSLEFEGDFSVYSYKKDICHHAVEVKYKKDIGQIGPRFCGNTRPSYVVTSEGNQMIVHFSSNWTIYDKLSRRGFRARIQPETPPPTTTLSTVAPRCTEADVVVVIDSSEGVMESNWPKIIDFVKNIVTNFSIGVDKVRVGVITYASHAEIPILLGQVNNVNDLAAAVEGIQYSGGSSNTHNGRIAMRIEFKTLGRQNVRRIGLFVTGGQASLPNMTILHGECARDDGMEIYVAGVDQYFDYEKAVDFTGVQKNIIQIESFDDLVSDLYNYGRAVYDLICLDDQLQTGNNVDWSCGFESSDSPLCDMIQEEESDEFDWTRIWGITPTVLTGPDYAAQGQYYIFIEASDPRQPGDRAVLYLPNLGGHGFHCVWFSYSMYGSLTGSLQLLRRTSSGSMIPVWLIRGNQGRHWSQAKISVSLQPTDQLAFVGKRGDGYWGDIAIDDIRVTSGDC